MLFMALLVAYLVCFLIPQGSLGLGRDLFQSAGLSHANHQSRNYPPDLSTDQSDGSIFSVEVCSAQMTQDSFILLKTPTTSPFFV